MKVTAIKAAVKTKGRYNIFVDGSYSFSLDESQLLDSGLHVGTELTESELTKLRQESELSKAYMRALDYIVRRPRSEKEIRDYGRRKEWEPDLTDQIIVRLKNKHYLDDETFARLWFQHRAQGKPTSIRKLRLELAQKGIVKELIDKIVAEAPESTEHESLLRMIEKKRRIVRYKDLQKLTEYLVRQGFRYDDVKAALEESIP
jgi:regulatory protein